MAVTESNFSFTLRSKDYLGTPAGKLHFNEQHFTESARRYDLATRLLSVGRDSSWKRTLIERLPAFQAPACLDLACGTGDLCFGLAEKYPSGRVVGVDITEAMLQIARERSPYDNVSFLRQNICELDFPACSFDVITGSYALRNAPDFSGLLSSVHNLLTPGGVAAFLDFSKPVSQRAQSYQYWLLKFWGSLWGLVLHGNPEVHGYISASLRDFPDRSALAELFRQNGLDMICGQRFFGGMIELTFLQKS